jgi:hypothetical protein
MLQLRDHIRLGNWKPCSWGKKRESGTEFSDDSWVLREDSMREVRSGFFSQQCSGEGRKIAMGFI